MSARPVNYGGEREGPLMCDYGCINVRSVRQLTLQKQQYPCFVHLRVDAQNTHSAASICSVPCPTRIPVYMEACTHAFSTKLTLLATRQALQRICQQQLPHCKCAAYVSSNKSAPLLTGHMPLYFNASLHSMFASALSLQYKVDHVDSGIML